MLALSQEYCRPSESVSDLRTIFEQSSKSVAWITGTAMEPRQMGTSISCRNRLFSSFTLRIGFHILICRIQIPVDNLKWLLACFQTNVSNAQSSRVSVTYVPSFCSDKIIFVLDKIVFVQDNFDFVWDKNNFFQAGGWGNSTYSIFVVFNNNSRKEEWRAIIMALFFGCKWHYCRVFLFRHEPPLVAYMETWQLICQLCHVDKECRRHFYCTFVQFHPKKEVSWHLSTSTGKWPFFSRWN